MSKLFRIAALGVMLIALIILARNTSAETRYVVHANDTNWSTDVIAIYRSTEGPTYTFPLSKGFSNFVLAPRSEKRIVDYGNLQTTAYGVTEFEYDPAKVLLESHLTFSNSSYFVVPSLVLTLAHQNDAVEISGIINDGITNTDLVFFNLEDYEALISVAVLDGYKYVGKEDFALPPGLSFRRLKTQTSIGAIIINDGYLGSVSYGSRVVGFAAVGKTGTPKIIPF